MGKKLPYTPRSRIRSALRQAWLRSRERNAAIKRERNTCESCHKKGSAAKGREVKITVHHKHGIGNWEKVIDMIYEEILCPPDNLTVLCSACHDNEHKGENEKDKTKADRTQRK
jgi:hypothetical protein